MAAAQRTINRPSWWAVSLTVGLAVALLLVAPSIPAAADAPRARDLERDWRFVETVLLNSEYGHRHGWVVRWLVDPVVYAPVENEALKPTIQFAVDEVNRALEPVGRRLLVEFEETDDFDIMVGVVSVSELPEFMARAGCTQQDWQTVYGTACLHIGVEDDAIFNSFVFIDKAMGEPALKSVLVEEISQSLGPMNDHEIYPQSLFFKDLGETRERTRLAPIDIQVLRFLYMYLEPGDDTATVRAKFDAHWRDVPVD